MDGVVSTDCFPHIDGDTDSVMKEAARVLKRGSLMVFTTHLQLDTLDATALAKVIKRQDHVYARVMRNMHKRLKPSPCWRLTFYIFFLSCPSYASTPSSELACLAENLARMHCLQFV